LPPIEKMKLLGLIGLFIGLTNLMLGQTLEDKQIVIQMSIDVDELQPYYHVDKIETRKPLIILNEGTVPSNLTLTKFEEEVQFMLKNEVFFYDKQAYLDFDKFDISPTQADIIFRYNIEGLIIKLTFEKVDNKWTIKTKKLKEK
jgi:hypothetical protein